MPMLNEAAAGLWSLIFNIALVFGAVVVGIATYGVFWTGSMKEFYSNASIAGANAVAGKANDEAAAARLAQEQLKTSNLELQHIVEQERHARVKLEKAVGFRVIEKDQFERIKTFLREHRVTVPVTVRWQNDPEAYTFAWILSEMSSSDSNWAHYIPATKRSGGNASHDWHLRVPWCRGSDNKSSSRQWFSRDRIQSAT